MRVFSVQGFRNAILQNAPLQPLCHHLSRINIGLAVRFTYCMPTGDKRNDTHHGISLNGEKLPSLHFAWEAQVLVDKDPGTADASLTGKSFFGLAYMSLIH